MRHLPHYVRCALLPPLAAIVVIVGCTPPDEAARESRVPSGTRISVEYTMKLDDGTEVASNVGDDPLVFEVGGNEIFPALEEAVKELAVGSTKTVELQAGEAYGARDDEATREIALALVPKAARSVGASLLAEDENGNSQEVRISEIRGDVAVLDLNHPLAGKPLEVAVKVLSVKKPPTGE